MTSESMKILRLPQVCELVGLRRSSVYQRIKTGAFPAPIELGPRARGWLESEVQGWLRKRIQASREAT
jgi:prophage regulatory protein